MIHIISNFVLEGIGVGGGLRRECPSYGCFSSFMILVPATTASIH